MEKIVDSFSDLGLVIGVCSGLWFYWKKEQEKRNKRD